MTNKTTIQPANGTSDVMNATIENVFNDIYFHVLFLKLSTLARLQLTWNPNIYKFEMKEMHFHSHCHTLSLSISCYYSLVTIPYDKNR